MTNVFDKIKGRHVLLIFILFILLSGLSTYFFSILRMEKIGSISQALLDLTLLTVIFWLLVKSNVKVKNIFGRFPISGIWLKVLVLVFILGVFSIGMGTIQSYFFPRATDSQDLYELYNFSDPLSLIVNNISIVVLVPLIEELIFRSILVHRWSRKWSTRTAILLSSIIFGLGHVDPISSFTFGLVACLLYIKTKSLWVTIGAHAFNNLVVTLIILSLAATYGSTIAQTAPSVMTGSELITGIVMVLISLPALVYFIRKNWPEKGTKLPYYTNS